MTRNPWPAIAGINGVVAVLAGAAGAHMLPPDTSSEALSLYRQAAFYHLSHALAIFGSGLLMDRGTADNARIANMSALAFQIGILGFAGTLYWLVIFGPGSLGRFSAVTPAGGVLLVFGWILMSVASWRIIWKQDEG